MHGGLMWAAMRTIFRGRSYVLLKRASKDLVEGVAHRRLLKATTNAVDDTKIPQERATAKLFEIGDWEVVTENGNHKLVKRLRTPNLEAVDFLVAVAILSDAAKLHPSLFFESWHTVRLEVSAEKPRNAPLEAAHGAVKALSAGAEARRIEQVRELNGHQPWAGVVQVGHVKASPLGVLEEVLRAGLAGICMLKAFPDARLAEAW